MQRFLVNLDLQNEIVINDKDLIHQLTKVLRIKINSQIILFNPNNNIDFIYNIISIEKNNIHLEKSSQIEKQLSNFKLNLYSALPNKIQKIEFILQKCCEIGVDSITFFSSQRSQKLNISENKKIRLENIIKEATEQSNRNSYLNLNFIDKLSLNSKIPTYFLHTKNIGSKHISEINNKQEINLIIGPEGGFNEEEINNFIKLSFIGIYLGGNILRTETASICSSFYIIQNNTKK